jgi:hypothetical protein
MLPLLSTAADNLDVITFPKSFTESPNRRVNCLAGELALGEDGTANLDLASLAETLKNSTAEESYQPGDPVEVAGHAYP